MARSNKASLRGARPRGKIWIILLALAIMVLSPIVASAQTSGFISAVYLQEICASDARGNEIVPGGHTACQAYIAGVVDYHKLTQSLNVAPTINICVPNTAPPRRLQNIVWQYLNKHGQHSEFIAAPAVALALYPHFPCKKKR